MNSDESNEKNKFAQPLDYRTQNLGFSTFATDPNSKSVNFKTNSAQAVQYNVGDIVGSSYRLLDQVGQGGMGVVYLAEHITFKQKYALKLLAPNQITETNWARFEIEGRALARIDHPNIVKIYNMGIDPNGCPFYVMDWLPGETLLDRMERERLNEQEILYIYAQVCAGLGSAHKNGIVHRDVKPSNIMLTAAINNRERSAVKVVDFGIASMSSSRGAQSLTTAGDIFGSPLYMSPEQCAGDKVDQRSDIYSLGCSIFHSLAGRPPFTGASALETMTQQVQKVAPTLAEVDGQSSFSDSLEHLVAKLLHKNPARRYQTMEQIIHDLDRIAAGKSILKTYTSADQESPLRKIATTSYERARHEHANADADADADADETLFVEDQDEEFDGKEGVEKHTSLITPDTALILRYSVIGVAILATLATAFFLLYHPEQNVPVPPQAHTAENIAGIENEPKSDEHLLYQQPLENYANDQSQPIASTNLTKMFFPTTFSLGIISWHDNQRERKIEAEKEPRVPNNTPLSFAIASEIGYLPRFLDKFAAANFVEVELTGLNKNASEVFAHLASWQHLEELRLINCTLGANDTASLDMLPHLKILRVNNVDISAKELGSAAIFKHIRSVDLDTVELSQQGYDKLGSSSDLIYLRLQKTDLTAADLETLARSKSLISLYVGSDTVTNASIKTISKMSQLRSLTVCSSEIDGSCIDDLSRLKALSSLIIEARRPWPDADVQRLKKALPAKCKFLYAYKPDGGCINQN